MSHIKELVLFVDDEPGMTQSVRRALHREPYEVLCANSPDDGLEILRSRHVSVVVSDERMPGTSGTEFLSIVRQDFPDTVRMMFTGYASLEAATRALNSGDVFRFLKKPCNETDLAIAVRQGLQHRQLLIKCRRMLEYVRIFREYVNVMSAKHPDSKQDLQQLLASVPDEPFTPSIAKLIEDLERELNVFLQLGSSEEGLVQH